MYLMSPHSHEANEVDMLNIREQTCSADDLLYITSSLSPTAETMASIFENPSSFPPSAS